jgi:tetratricopeptide (TPR) repeat protein
MKMKNSNKKYNYGSQLKSSTSLSFRFCFYIFCFTFLSFRLATSLTGVVYANSAADSGRKLSQGSILTSVDPNNVNALELLRADLSVAYGKNDTKSKDQLRSIIEQIRSIEFERQKQIPEPVVVPEKSPAVEPNKTVLDVPEQKEQVERAEQVKRAVEPKQQQGLISEKTTQVLRALAKNPGKVGNPFELGEILFVCGNLKEAAVFYSEALKRKDPNDAGESQDRAWILFQIGNCLCNDDMPAAAKMYQRLLTEYPNSPWAALATARNNLIAWYRKDEPFKLIQQVDQTGSEQNNGGQDKHE